MNGNTRRALRARAVRNLSILALCLLFATACDTPPSGSDDVAPHAMSLPKSFDVVYGPMNPQNPFEHVGLRHNDAVHSVLRSAEAWDTLSIPTMNARIRRAIPTWAETAMDTPADRALAHVKTGFALRIDTTARRLLAGCDAVGRSEREARYLRRIGSLLCDAGSFEELERGLLAIEADALGETWPADRTRENSALIAVSVAKHSLAYWKRLFLASAGFAADGEAAALGKMNGLLIHIVTKAEMVVGCDVLAAVTVAEGTAVFGPLGQLEAAIISGGTVSILVATLVYWEDIVSFLRDICPWKN